MPRRRTTHPPRALSPDAEACANSLFTALAEAGAEGHGVPCQRDQAAEGQAGLWTSDDRDDLERAAALCRSGCPSAVRVACASYAVAAKVTHGAWGGVVRIRA